MPTACVPGTGFDFLQVKKVQIEKKHRYLPGEFFGYNKARMVSIVVPNWNGKRYLESCLSCLRAQTYPETEVILVDGGSTDGSIEFVKGSYPEARILLLGENKGFSKAANEGLRIARGEFVALLNNDTMADSGWITELVKGITSSIEIGFCASKILRAPGGKTIDTAGDCYTRYGVAKKRGRDLEANRFDQPELVFGACAAAALYRKSMLEEIGFFDEDLFCVYEDVDLSFRAQLAGYRCLYIPTAIVRHTVGGTMGTDNDFTLYYGQRNMETVFFKNMPGKLLIKYLTPHIAYLLLAFTYNLTRGKGRIYVRSKVDALKQMARTLQKRRLIQGKKKPSSGYLQTVLDKHSFLDNMLKAA
jgi:GT2 family glycosyltransferase